MRHPTASKGFLGSLLHFPWSKKNHETDPYWDYFINTPPTDRANSIVDLIRNAPEGNVFPTKADLHTPEITSSHLKELAHYLGTDLVGIARVGAQKDTSLDPFAVICVMQADHEPREARGIGGQVPVQKGLFVTFVLSAWIRELGFRATAAPDPEGERLATVAGLGALDQDGKLTTKQFGNRVYVADIICTDLPLAADGEGSLA